MARHKLVDHWRRQAREERILREVAPSVDSAEDPWDERLDALRARTVLDGLGPHHRAALTLRYMDATEALLVRARAAFRRAYTEEEGRGG